MEARSMIIFLYGQDTYRSRQKLNEIIEYYKKIHKNGLSLKFFSDENLNFQEFKDETKSVSMFAGKKLIILRNVIKNREFKEKFLAESKRFINSDDIILFFEEGEIKKNDSLLQIFKKSGRFQEFELLGGQKLKGWIKKEFEKYPVKIGPTIPERLISFVGNDLWRLSNEIQKLASYKKNRTIEIKDVDLLIKPKIETDIFKTIDAIASKNKKQALSLIHKHLEKGDSPLYLLSMINFQFRNLLIIKDLIERKKTLNALFRETRLHPYVVKKSYSQAQKFKIEDLKKIYQKIFQVDLAIKTGRITPKTALDLFIAEI